MNIRKTMWQKVNKTCIFIVTKNERNLFKKDTRYVTNNVDGDQTSRNENKWCWIFSA